MYILQLIRQFLHDMRKRKLRTALAMFGIAWGTLSVVILLALGESFHRASQKSMHGIGEHLLIVSPATTTKAYAGLPPGRQIQMKHRDAVEMASAIPEIGRFSPELHQGGCVLSFGAKQTQATITGVMAQYDKIRSLIPTSGGRFFNQLDVGRHRQVIFLGNKLKQRLFGRLDGVGKTILVDGRPFLVIGTLKQKAQMASSGGKDDKRAFIPFSTFISIWGDQNVRSIVVQPRHPDVASAAKDAIYRSLSEKYRFDPEDQNAVYIWDMIEVENYMNWFFWCLRTLLTFGGVLTLSAGGIGVANVMFLIVKERTREFGIRMAIGARDWHIALQVMLEVGIIVIIGGATGFAVATLIIQLLNLFSLPDWLGTPEVSSVVGVATVLVLAFIAFLSGAFPARRAAQIQPVEALES